MHRLTLPLALLAAALFACNAGTKKTATDTAAATAGTAPAPVDSGSAPVAAPDPKIALVATSLQTIFKSDLDKNLIDSLSRQFVYAAQDLNGDGQAELFVGTKGPYFCGSGGCTILLLDPQGALINRFTVAGYPVIIDSAKTKGWSNLIIHSGKQDRLLKFDGKKYPANPSTQPAVKETPGDVLVRVLGVDEAMHAW